MVLWQKPLDINTRINDPFSSCFIPGMLRQQSIILGLSIYLSLSRLNIRNGACETKSLISIIENYREFSFLSFIANEKKNIDTVSR